MRGDPEWQAINGPPKFIPSQWDDNQSAAERRLNLARGFKAGDEGQA